MSATLTLDRFEGDGKSLAVLVSDDGAEIVVPKSLLPARAKPADVLTVDFKLDEAATRAVKAEAADLQAKLKATDPGGDIAL